jgi:hypothetical protein
VTRWDALEPQFTLRTATARFDELRGRDDRDDLGEPGRSADPTIAGRVRDEAPERLALGELIARKAGYGRQLDVQTARVAGASWRQIGAALGVTRQAAWEAHNRWIDEQAALNRAADHEGIRPRGRGRRPGPRPVLFEALSAGAADPGSGQPQGDHDVTAATLTIFVIAIVIVAVIALRELGKRR